MAQSFITQFHEIQGDTVGERQRNLNKLLTNVSINPEERQLVLDTLKPKTYLENLFYIDVLIHLRATSQLREILKDGNGAFVSKIIKQQWFFQEVLSNIDVKSLVHDFLPSLSFSVKLKLFKHLPHVYNEERIDQVFDCVTDRYGLFIATSFLTACSSEKIANVLKNNNIKLSTPQLRVIYKKDPKLINIYLEEQKQYNNENIFDNKFLTYLAQDNPIYFWEIMEKHKIKGNLKLGRRTTKKLIPAKTQEIVTNPKKYIKYLRHETLVRKLNKQGNFKQLYYNLFPRNIEVLESKNALCNSILKYYPKSDQYNLFAKTFHDIIKEDIWHYPSCMHSDLLAIIFDKDVREKWAHMKYKESDDEEYLKFYETKKSIAMIKEKINSTSGITNRSKLLAVLVKSCAVDKDLKTLEEVLEYFCTRHRNDDKTSRAKVLQAIEGSFNIKELNSIHWKYIHDMFTLQTLNEEYTTANCFMRLQHIDYLFTHNGTEEEKKYFISEYIKDQVERNGMELLGVEKFISSTEVQKTILLQAVEQINTILDNLDTSNSLYIKSQLLAKIFWFNVNNPDSKIDIEANTEIVEMLKKLLDESTTAFLSHMFYINFAKAFCKLNRSDFENTQLNRFFTEKSVRVFNFGKMLRWCLNHDPMVIVTNFDAIKEEFTQIRPNILNVIKRLSHLSLDDKLRKYSVHQLRHAKPQHKSEHIRPLSVISSSEYYLKVMEDLNLIPTSSSLVIEDAEAKRTFRNQRTFLKYMKNTSSPLKCLPFLLDKFCKGDFLRDSLAPLYFMFHKVSQNKLQTYLDTLSNTNAVSVKKHALYLACQVFDQQNVVKVSTNLRKIKNHSLHKCLCLLSLRYFSKNPNQDNFEVMLSYLPFLKQHDIESLKLLTSIQIPKNYKALYIAHIWNLLKNLETDSDEVGFSPLRSAVLGNIDRQCISNLPEEFCKTILNNYFGTSMTDVEVSNFFRFVIEFLMNKSGNFTYVFTLLSLYKSKFWDLNGMERKTVYKFFDVFYTIAFEKQIDLDFVNKFSKEWQGIFSPTDTFKEYVSLNLLKFIKEANENLESYSKNLISFAEQINTEYGGLVLSRFISILSKSFIFANKNQKRVELLTKMIECSTSSVSCILIMELISIKGDLFYKNKVRAMYREIDLILRQVAVTDPKVRLHYNLYSRNI